MDRKTEALMTLLFDEDRKVAMHALEQLLADESPLDELIKEFQDSDVPHVRKRIHQVTSILARRQRRKLFIEAVRANELSLMDGLMQLALLTNPRLSEAFLESQLAELKNKVRLVAPDTDSMVAFMRRCNFFVPETFCLEAEMLQIDNVFKYRLGSPVILSALAHALGKEIGWESSVVIYEGVFCLVDQEQMLINPTYSWKVTRIDALERAFPCKSRDIWYNVMSQLFLTALQDGNIQDIHFYGSLLSELFDSTIGSLPYPVGDLIP